MSHVPSEHYKVSGQHVARSQEGQKRVEELTLTFLCNGLSILCQAPGGQGQLPGFIPAPDINIPSL